MRDEKSYDLSLNVGTSPENLKPEQALLNNNAKFLPVFGISWLCLGE
jgi:hypothetical protein